MFPLLDTYQLLTKAVAVQKEGVTVGHVPFNLSSLFSSFLRREANAGFAKVTGPQIYRGAGYGMEVPCTYILYGPLKPYVLKLKELLDNLKAKSLIYRKNIKNEKRSRNGTGRKSNETRYIEM